MKIYGSEICIDCRNFAHLMSVRGLTEEFIDITASTANLREFLKYRDTDPIFDAVRQRGGIGIPFFVRENGETTIDADTALSWIGQEPARKEEYPESRCDENGCK